MPYTGPALFTDTETYSTIGGPGDVGAPKYTRHCSLLCAGWQSVELENGEIVDVGDYQSWDSSDPDPLAYQDLEVYTGLLNNPRILKIAHNSQFDRLVLHHTLSAPIDPEQWWCTATMALLHALPPSLEQLGKVLGLPEDQQKLKDGKKLIQRFCKPAPRNHKADRYDHESHPEEWARFLEYLRNDVVAMVEIYKRLPRINWTKTEIGLWHLDQRMNDRGVRIDRELAQAGADFAVQSKEILRQRFAEITGGLTHGQRAKCHQWLLDRGVGVLDTRKETFEAIKDYYEWDDPRRSVMEIMIASNKSSTSKYRKALDCIDDDDTFRGMLRYAGASRTGRWAGRDMQLQNLPSRGIPKQSKIDVYTRALRDGVADLLYGDEAMLYGSAAIRNMLIPRPGHKFTVSDLSNIEGRKVAWFAGEQWKLDAFRAFDRGDGPDLYNITATDIVGGDPWDVPKSIRNAFGKVPELAFGFQGGVVGMGTFCKAYGVTMAENWDTIRERTDERFVLFARENYDEWGAEKNPEIEQKEWIARETIKLAWRAKHPATVQLWKDLSSAAKSAILDPGSWYKAGPLLSFTCRVHPPTGIKWLFLRLPSGRYLCYPFARISDSGTIHYRGQHQQSGLWIDLKIYGGKFLENAAQGSACDVLKWQLPKMLDAGYFTLFTVHDEGIAEVPNENRFTAQGYSDLLKSDLPWSKGLPLAAAGEEVMMYQKI